MKVQNNVTVQDQEGNSSKPLLSSRLFKFRAWGTKIKWMSKPFSFGQVLNFNNQIIKSLTTDEIVMQFTGLKDKNEVEIYEGDIITNWGINYLVEYELYDNMQGFSIDSDDSDLEVIGNVFENPDLL